MQSKISWNICFLKGARIISVKRYFNEIMSHIFFTDCRLPCFKLFWCYRRVYGAIESFFRFLQSYGSLWGYESQWYYRAKGVYTSTKTSYKTKYKFMGLLKSTKLWESAMLLVHGATGDDNLHGYGSTELRESTKLRACGEMWLRSYVSLRTSY